MASLCLNVMGATLPMRLMRLRGIRNHCLFPYVVVLSQGRSVT